MTAATELLTENASPSAERSLTMVLTEHTPKRPRELDRKPAHTPPAPHMPHRVQRRTRTLISLSHTLRPRRHAAHGKVAACLALSSDSLLPLGAPTPLAWARSSPRRARPAGATAHAAEPVMPSFRGACGFRHGPNDPRLLPPPRHTREHQCPSLPPRCPSTLG